MVFFSFWTARINVKYDDISSILNTLDGQDLDLLMCEQILTLV